MEEDHPPALKRKTSLITGLFSHLANEVGKDLQGNDFSMSTWCIGVLVMEKTPDLEELQKLVDTRMVQKYHRYRSRLLAKKSNFLGIYQESEYVEVDHMDWAYHLSCAFDPKSDESWDKEKLDSFIGELSEFQYDHSKPLWRLIVVPRMKDNSCVIISCTNHAVGDGISLVTVTLDLMDPAKEVSKDQMKHKGKRTVAAPMTTLDFMAAKVRGFFQGLTSVITPQDSKNALKVIKPSGKKLVASTGQIPLAKINQIKEKFEGATINDILMALLTLTVKAYLLENDKDFTIHSKVSAQFPISLRPAGSAALRNGEPTNTFGFGAFTFDFAVSDRALLVWDAKEQMDEQKVSPLPHVTISLVKLLARFLPVKIVTDLSVMVGNIGTAQISNVPGPQTAISLLGVPVSDIYFYLFSPLGLYLGILSYNGTVSAAVNLDGSLGVDPHELAKHWSSEFDLLYNDIMNREGVIKKPKNTKRFLLNLITVMIPFFLLLFCAYSMLSKILSLY